MRTLWLLLSLTVIGCSTVEIATGARGGPAQCAPSGYRDRLVGTDPKPPGQCLPMALDRDPSGQVNCVVIEARADGDPTCASAARSPVASEHLSLVEIAKSDPYADPAWNSFCEVVQLRGEAGVPCETVEYPSSGSGYCYVADDDPPTGARPWTEGCGWAPRRMLHFVGNTLPLDSFTFIFCDPTPGACE
jgi:hypothetical protein